jgi:hypothetical protein
MVKSSRDSTVLGGRRTQDGCQRWCRCVSDGGLALFCLIIREQMFSDFFYARKLKLLLSFHWRKVREPQEALMSRRVIMSWRLMGKREWFFHCRCPTWVLQIDCSECGTPTICICLTWLLSTILWIHGLDSSGMRSWTHPSSGKACTREWCSWLRTTEGWNCWISEQIQQYIGSINGPPIISTNSITSATKSFKPATLLQMYAAMEDQFFL